MELEIPFCYNINALHGGDYMVELANSFQNSKQFDINSLLETLDLPVRLSNILKSSDFYSEENFYKMVEKLTLQYTSQYFLPNQLVSFYPQVKERRASRDLVCNLSGAIIKKGRFYYTYHPFLENLNTGRVYTIHKNIHAELGYIDCFPQDLFTYEDWYYRLKNAYYGSDNGMIDFYFLSCECGEDCLDLYPLGRSKGKK